MVSQVTTICHFQEPQSAPPAIKDYGNGDPKLRKSCVDRQLVGQHIYCLNCSYKNGYLTLFFL